MSSQTTAPAKTEHTMGSVFELDGQHTAPCSCGKRFTSDTPAKAAARWRGHTPKIPRQTTSQDTERIRTCGCGCGGALAARANGLFLSGHDARYKSVLARAHTEGATVRDPRTGESASPLEVAAWLDQRRGNNSTFWQDKVRAGVKQPLPSAPRAARRFVPDGELRGEAKADHLMQMLEARRPAAGQEGFYVRRDGRGKYPARVVTRVNDQAIKVRVLDGPMRNQEVVIPDERFEKTKKGH